MSIEEKMPMLNDDIAALVGHVPPSPPFSVDAIPFVRANMAAMGRAVGDIAVETVTDHEADGVPVRLYRPTGDAPPPLMVFVHGGGFLFGDLETHDAMCRHVAVAAGCAVLAVGYRLAPEHPFPAGLDDVAAAFAWARREAGALGCDPARIALGGESAGANLSAAITLQLRDAGDAQPLFQLLVHPLTSFGFELPAMARMEELGLARDYAEAMRTLYVGDQDHRNPLISPLHATRHDGLAPAIILTASEDALRDDGEYYARALVEAGVETLACRLPGLPHGFMFLPVALPSVDNAYRLIGRLIRRYFTPA
jgi:acetyl esterase